ncbi:MAG: response regulator [Chitinophagaceae bacterium]|nr:MAG: response regulator [Chitinophagaceae bacterium]
MMHPNLPQKHLVLIDDDSDACLLFERALRKVDPELYFTALYDGEHVSADLERLRPDLLFLDLTLPGKNGLDCLLELRAQDRFNHVRVIVYSNSVRMSDIAQAYERGADLFIVKPFSQSHLVNALEHVLQMNWAENGRNRYFINNQFVPFTAGTCAA